MSWIIEIWMKPMPTIETKIGIMCILTIVYGNIVMGDWNLDEKIHINNNSYNIINL